MSLTTRPQLSRPQFRRLVVAAFLFVVPLVYFFPATIGKVLLAPGDGWSQIFGIRVLMGQMFAKGELPLWNPYIFGGMPLLASIQPGALYPPSWLFAVFTPKLAMNLMIITTYHIALAGTYLFARRLGQSRLGALTAALAFAFGGYMVAHLGHSNRIAAAAWLPWILLSIEELYLRPRWRWVCIGAACIALQLFAGEPQMTCYTAITAGAYTLYSLTLRGSQAPRRHVIAALAAMCICGGLLSAIQLLPEGEMLRYTERSAITYEYFTQFSLPPHQIIGFFFPYYFGGAPFEPYQAEYWGRWNNTETAGYAAMFVWLCLFLAIGSWRKAGVHRFWLFWAVIALGLSLGDNLPFGLYHVMHKIPVYKLFRAPGRHLVEFNLAVGLLAGFGITALTTLEARLRWRLVAISSAALATIVIICVALYRFSPQSLKTELPLPPQVGNLGNPDLFVPVVFFALSVLALLAYARKATSWTSAMVAVLLLLDAMSYGFFYEWRLQSFDLAKRMRDPASVRFIKDREPDWRAMRIVSASVLPFKEGYDMLDYPNVSIVRGLQSVNGYDPMRLLRTTDIAGHMTLDGWMEEAETLAQDHRGFDLLNVKYLLMEPTTKDKVVHEGIEFNTEPSQLKFTPGTQMAFEINATATELALITAMGNAIYLKTGTPILEVKLTTKDGRVITQQLLAGRDTGEWAHDNPEVHNLIQHTRPPVIESWPVNNFEGHRYLARLKFDRSIITRVEARYLADTADLTLFRAALYDEVHHRSAVLSSFNLSPDRWRFLEQFDSVSVYENTQAMPRAWFVRNWHVAPSTEVLKTIKTGKFADGRPFNPRETVLLESEIYGAQPAKLPPPGDPTGSDVKLTRYEPHRIDLQTRNAQTGFLVLSEIYYRGWEAFIDGQRVPVERVNYTLRGISVPAGEHKIRFVFRSPSLRTGMVYSAMGLLLLLAGAVISARRKGKPGSKDQQSGHNNTPPLTPLNNELNVDSSPNTAPAINLENESPATPAKFKRPTRLHPLTIALLLGALAYGGFLLRYGAYAVGGSDSSGYANLARAVTKWKFVYTPEPIALLDLPNAFTDCFRPLAYVPGTKPGTLAPFYAVGYPLHQAAGALLLGWSNGPFVVNPIVAALGLLLFYLLGIELGLSRAWSLLGALLLACSPGYLAMGLQPMSDLVTTFWALLGIWAALRARHHERFAILAGAAFGLAVLIRPTSILLLLPLAFCLRLNLRSLLYFGLGGLPMAAVFFAYNYAAYGGIVSTGYGAAGYFALMKASYFPPRFGSYLYWLAVSMSPLPLIGWLLCNFETRLAWRKRALLLTWFGSFLLFYCFYEIYEGWFYLRFLLPAIPALILGTLLFAQSAQERLAHRLPKWSAIAVIALLCVFVIGAGAQMIYRENILHTGPSHYINSRSARWAQSQLPPNALVVAAEQSGALRYYTNRSIVRWDLTAPDQWQTIQSRLTEKGWKTYALLMSHEVAEAQRKLSGKWNKLGDYQNVSLWQIETAP